MIQIIRNKECWETAITQEEKRTTETNYGCSGERQHKCTLRPGQDGDE